MPKRSVSPSTSRPGLRRLAASATPAHIALPLRPSPIQPVRRAAGFSVLPHMVTRTRAGVRVFAWRGWMGAFFSLMARSVLLAGLRVTHNKKGAM